MTQPKLPVAISAHDTEPSVLLEQGAVGMTPGPGILGKFLFRVGIELLEGYDVRLERSHILEKLLFALRLFGESIPDVVAQDPEFGSFFISFGKKLNGKEAKEG